MIVFGSIFFLVGTVLFWTLFLVPLYRANQAQRWPQAPCVIISSEVRMHSDSEGTSYSPEIHYQYTLDGAVLESTRYRFIDTSGGYSGAKRIVDKYPVGLNTKCFYDPKHPDQAVLDRTIGWGVLFGLVPLVFVLLGAGVVFAGIYGPRIGTRPQAIRFARSIQSADGSSSDAQAADFEGPKKLRPTEPRMMKLAGLLVTSLFWNGIVSVFVLQFLRQPQWFLGLFLAPFVLVGILIILGFFHSLLAMANPKVEVALSNGAVSLGESIDVAWQLEGRTNRIRQLKVWIEAVEHATYTRGSSTITDKSIFQVITLYDGVDRTEFSFGTRTIQIPADTMHTFRASKNKVLWTVRIRGRIPFWPDIDEAFEFFVKPKRSA
jgi:hypothetical protein